MNKSVELKQLSYKVNILTIMYKPLQLVYDYRLTSAIILLFY